MRPIALFDTSHLFHRVVYSNVDDLKQSNFEDWGLVRHVLIDSVLTAAREVDASEVVLAADVRPYWREEIYPLYKSGRREARDKSPVDWDRAREFFWEFAEDVAAFFPWKFVGVKGAEADDVIAVLAMFLHRKRPVVVVSSDRDFAQLERFSNVKLYDPMKREYVTSASPETDLLVKILCGDAGDAIGNVKMDDAACEKWLNREIKKPALGEKGAEKILREGLDEFLDANGYRENFERNKTLIDFSRIPERLAREIVGAYRNAPVNRDASALMTHLASKKLRRLAERVSEIMGG